MKDKSAASIISSASSVIYSFLPNAFVLSAATKFYLSTVNRHFTEPSPKDASRVSNSSLENKNDKFYYRTYSLSNKDLRVLLKY